MQVNRQMNKGRGRPTIVYVCATHRTRGSHACPERHSLSATAIHEAIVFSLRKVLTPEHLDALLKTWAEDRPDHEAKRGPVQAELARVEAELKKLADAVAGGAAVQTPLDGMKAREAERRELLAQLEHLDGLMKAAARYDSKAHLAAWKTILPDWHQALTGMGPSGRQYLRSLLRGPIFVSRGTDGVWRYEGQGTLGDIFKGWLGIRIPDAELEAMNTMAEDRNLAAELEQMVDNLGRQPEDLPQLIESSDAGLEPARLHNRWCRERGSNPHGLSPKGF